MFDRIRNRKADRLWRKREVKRAQRLHQLKVEFYAAITGLNRPYPVIMEALRAVGVVGVRGKSDSCPLHKYIWMRLSVYPLATLLVHPESISLMVGEEVIGWVDIEGTDLSLFIKDFDAGQHIDLAIPGIPSDQMPADENSGDYDVISAELALA